MTITFIIIAFYNLNLIFLYVLICFVSLKRIVLQKYNSNFWTLHIGNVYSTEEFKCK